MLRELGPFPGSLPPNPACGFHRTGLSRDLCRVRDVPAALAENAKYHFGFLHCASLMVLNRSSPVPLHPVVRLSRSPDWADVTPPITMGTPSP